ncbi:S-adenosyl-L-methionine-dependent methyltransferase [Lipomyces chichibuensis]|uniref:S-adenosyl-L-methionine-dependent methyltransferase n=1 Tax=Lipomyces chichibuensis TaxID=1546026 RepID=UPI003343C852
MSDTNGKSKEVYIRASSLAESDGESDSSSSSDYESARQSLSPLGQAQLLAARSISEYQQISRTLLAKDALLLDFACGTGALSQRLAARVDNILGIDVDAGAVQQFNTRARNQGIDEDEMCAIHCDILTEESLVRGKAWFGKVDVVASAMAFHHLQDIAAVTKILVDRFLKVDGWIAVVDLMHTPYTSAIFANAKKPTASNPDKSRYSHNHLHRHAHHVGGIKAEDIRRAFECAGLDCVDIIEHIFDISVMVPRRLLSEEHSSNEVGSSSKGQGLSAIPDSGKVEVLLPFLLAIGKKL